MKSIPGILLLLVAFALNVHVLRAGAPEGSMLSNPEEGTAFGSIKGVVLDEETQDPLAGVNITLQGTRKGAVSRKDGTFRIADVPVGTYTLKFTLIGYADRNIGEVTVVEDEIAVVPAVGMKVQPIPLKEIVVSPGAYSIGGVGPSRQTITGEDIEIMAFAEDITKFVQKVPGITGDDFSAKFNIRGGDRDETLFMLDGMQLYKPYHQKDFGGGLFSTIDIQTIESVDVLTGGFTAEYGDRQSGVLDMKTRKPDPNEGRRSVLEVSLISANAFSMGSFNEGKSSWMVSGRRGYLDLLNILTKDEFKLSPKYFDVYGKIDHELSSNHFLSFNLFTAIDRYRLDELELEPGLTTPNIDFSDTEFGNHYSWLTLKSFFGSNLYARSILYGGLVTQDRFWNNLDNDPKAHYTRATLRDQRDMTLFGLKQDWNYDASSRLLLKFGFDAKRLETKYDYTIDLENEIFNVPDTVILRETDFSANTTLEGQQLGLYGSLRFQLLDPLTLETGMRYDYASYTDDKLWSPRVNAVYSLTGRTFLRAGWGYFYQIQSNDDLRVQFQEFETQPAQKAEHFVAGVEHYFENGIYFRTEGYLKKMTRIPDRYINLGSDIDEFYPESRDDLVQLTIDKGEAKGLEFYLKRDTGGKFSWWLSYIWSKVTDDVTDITTVAPMTEQLGTQPRIWDQPHTINIDVNYRPTPGWLFNIAWHYRTGWTFTDFTVERIQREDGTFAFYKDHEVFNDSRYPDYHRLDIRVNKNFFTSKGKITVYLHVINAYNHENVSGFDHEVDLKDPALPISTDVETFYGLLPFGGVSWEF